MNYIDLLRKTSNRFNSIVSLGLDPVIDDIPINSGTIKDRILSFYESILNRIIQQKIYPAAVKPNFAFYSQYGIEGIEALVLIIRLFKSEGFPVILDVKRGDIGKTSKAYSKEAFEFLKADAVTLSPFMGFDSISPFIDNYPNKGYYILNKTSNKSSREIQDILINGSPFYTYISKKIIDWHTPGIGAVVGGTNINELKNIANIFFNSKKNIPLLIPGIGSQGGSVEDVVNILKKFKDLHIHRINSSSSINYAYKKHENLHFSNAAVKELKILNNKIDSALDKK